MILLTISVSLLAFLLTLIFFYRKGVAMDVKSRRLGLIRKRNPQAVEDEFEKPFVQRVILPLYNSVIKRLSALFPKKKGSNTQKIETNLRLAGLRIAVNEYNAARLVLSGVVVLVLGILMAFARLGLAPSLLIVLIGLLFSLLVPSLFLKMKIKKRQANIAEEMPDVMDLLCVSMEAGLGFDAAMVKIGERLSGVLVTELNIVQTEINYGKPRREALKSLAERNAVEELKTFVGSIIQAEQLGIPINQVLKAQAEELRVKRRQRAEEKAMKAPVKMMIPLVIFVLPVLFIVLLGPTILQVVDQFGGI